MDRATLKVLLRNLGILVFAALPVFLVLVWLSAFVRGVSEARDLLRSLEAGAFWYLSLVLPVALGGLTHQFLLLALPNDWSARLRRAIAMVGVLSVPVVDALLGQPVDVMLWFWPALLVSMALYALLVRLPAGPA